MSEPWPCEDPPGAAAHTTRQVLGRVAPIVRVTHDPDDGSWQFWDGRITSDRDNRVVSLEDVVRLDPTVAALADLPLGWTARRVTIGNPCSCSDLQRSPVSPSRKTVARRCCRRYTNHETWSASRGFRYDLIADDR